MSGRKKDNIISGTPQGGRKAAKTNREKHGNDFYERIGAIGGKASNTGGFAKKKACDCELIYGEHTVPQCVGKKGGTKSRRNINA